MSFQPEDEIVRLVAADLVTVRMYQQGLTEAGIESRVVGEDLEASFGTALMDSVELWVRETDAARAVAVLRELEEEEGISDEEIAEEK